MIAARFAGLTGGGELLLESPASMNRWCLAVLAAVLTACSSGTHGSAGAPAGDPIAFPLFDGANMLSAHEWPRRQPDSADRLCPQ